MKYPSFYLFLFLFLAACQNQTNVADYAHIPNAFDVQIDIPAGDVKDQSFLPYLTNVGFVGSANATTILILSKRLEKGKLVKVRPIATLQIIEQNQPKNIIITSPVDSLLSLSPTTNFQQFITANAGEKQIIQDWFLYQKGLGETTLVGWQDEKFATDLLERFD